MTQESYIAALDQRIGSLPDNRRQEILEDIRAHFMEGRQEGVPEEALVRGLGAPEILAREYRTMYAAERAREKTTVGNVLRAVWAGIGMGMLNLIFVLPIAAAVFAVWISFLLTGAALALGGVAASLLALGNIVIPLSFLFVSYPWVAVFGGIATCAAGLLLLIGMLYAGRGMGRATVRYIHSNIEIISGRRSNHEK